MDDVGPDLAVRALDPLFDLGQEAIDQAVTTGSLGQDPTRGPEPDVPGDRAMGTASQLGRGPVTAGQIERLEDSTMPSALFTLPPRLLTPNRGESSGWAASVAASGLNRWPRPGSFVTGYGQIPMSVVILGPASSASQQYTKQYT